VPATARQKTTSAQVIDLKEFIGVPALVFQARGKQRGVRRLKGYAA
jgi:hypothetical protein